MAYFKVQKTTTFIYGNWDEQTNYLKAHKKLLDVLLHLTKTKPQLRG